METHFIRMLRYTYICAYICIYEGGTISNSKKYKRNLVWCSTSSQTITVRISVESDLEFCLDRQGVLFDENWLDNVPMDNAITCPMTNAPIQLCRCYCQIGQFGLRTAVRSTVFFSFGLLRLLFGHKLEKSFVEQKFYVNEGIIAATEASRKCVFLMG